MKESGDGVSISILGKEFMIACPPHEREALLAAANYLDKKMREIQASGKVLGTERTAIVAALNIANELLDLKAHGGLSSDVAQKLRFLQNKIDAALRWDVHPSQ
ncbi:MAG: cell division protein ZapA [Gammaproteobacteria bacterium]